MNAPLRPRGLVLLQRHVLVAIGAVGAVFACHGETGMDRGRELEAQAAEAAADQAEQDGEEQERRDLAIDAIENGRGAPPRPLDNDELEGVLAFYCSECHGADRSADDELPGPVFDSVEDLLKVDKVVPGDAAASRLIVRLQSGEMPPPSSGLPAVPPATIGLVADFIDNLPAEP